MESKQGKGIRRNNGISASQGPRAASGGSPAMKESSVARGSGCSIKFGMKSPRKSL